MSVSWETPPSVLVCILHTEIVTTEWAMNIRRLIIPGPFQDPVLLTGMPFDHARNTACMRALDVGAEWLMFVDSDVLLPKDSIVRLLSRGKPFISGVYARRSPPVGIPVMMKPVGQWVTTLPPNTIIDVDVVGSGCMLIHRSLLERLPPSRAGKHWFDWRVDLKGTNVFPLDECTSEDFSFCLELKKKLGIPTLIDTSVICGHIGLGISVPGHFAPVGAITVV